MDGTIFCETIDEFQIKFSKFIYKYIKKTKFLFQYLLLDSKI